MATGDFIRSPIVNGLMQTAALCPFCGARQGTEEATRLLRFDRGIKGIQRFYVQCWMCGASGAHEETVEGAFANWNNRPDRAWTPLAASSFEVGKGNFGHVIVHEDGQKVSFVDWLEDEIHSQVDIDLGRFRICDLKPLRTAREEVARTQRLLGQVKKEDEYR